MSETLRRPPRAAAPKKSPPVGGSAAPKSPMSFVASAASNFRSDDAQVPLWLAVAGLVVAGVFGASAAQSGEQIVQIGLITGAAAAGGIGVYGLGERLWRNRNGSSAEIVAQFERLYAAAPEPTALVDATGRVRAFNRAASRIVDARARRAADLPEGMADPEGVVFRLLRGALRNDPSTEVAPLRGDGGATLAEISAWPCGRGLVAWRWRMLEEEKRDPLAAASSVAWFRIDADGRFTAASRRFHDWVLGDAPSAALDAEGRREPPPSAASNDLDPAGGLSAEALVGLDAQATFPELGKRLLAGDRGATLPRTLLRGAGKGPRNVSLVIAPLRDGGGRLGVVTPAPRGVPDGPRAGAGGDALDGLASSLLFDESPIGLAVLSTDGVVRRANPVAERLLSGPDRPSVVDAPLTELLAEDDREDAVRRLAEVVGPQYAAWSDVNGFDARLVSSDDDDGEPRAAEFHLTRVDGPKGPLVLCYVIDASERLAFEERFIQTQKLQAVGQLAGGVAHDFNNLLQVIIGASEMLLQRRSAEDGDFADLNAIYQNAHRAATLVGQLLAFSRKQTLRPQVVNLTERMSDLSYLLNRLIGEKVLLRQDFSEELWDAKVDVNQFEQVITNLVVNARDAMPDGGKVALRTRNLVYAPTNNAAPLPMPAGEYVVVEVEDTGCGIPKEKLQKIFEPFYTTKGVGEGTGLGLSTVYGIVKQTGGFIFVDSEVDVGTVFRIFLRRHAAQTPELENAASTEDAAEGAPLAPVEVGATGLADLSEPVGDDVSVQRARSELAERSGAPSPADADGRSRAATGVGVPVAPRRPSDEYETPSPPSADMAAPPGGATILLVEDEAPVRTLTARALRARGYDVFEAECGEDALEILRDPDARVDLLLSDVVMPNMDGPTLLSHIADQRRDLKVLFMSGYARDAFSGAFATDLKGRKDYGFLQKPFTLTALERAVRDQIVGESQPQPATMAGSG